MNIKNFVSGKNKKNRKRERARIARERRAAAARGPEMTEEEYEAKKTAILRRAVLAENQYNELRAELREHRMGEIRKLKSAVEAGTDKYYLEQKAKAEADYKLKHEINVVNYQMKMAQIADEYEARSAINKKDQEDQYQYAKDRFIDFFTELIREKEKREDEVGQIMAALLCLPPRPSAQTTRPILKSVAYPESSGGSSSATHPQEAQPVQNNPNNDQD